MSVSTEISRLQTDRNTIRAKLVELGLAQTTANLDALATAIENIVNRGAVSATVQEGDTYTIPAGYHNGSGTVSGVAGGGNYSLQSKSATPTKKQQSITPDSGYYGLSDVTVAAIPEAYQDVTSVTAAAADVLTGKIYVAADGTVTAGTMTNNGAVSKTLDTTTISYTIPKGFHSGEGVVTLTLETKTVTPSTKTQTVTPTAGKVLSSVTVNAIPSNYQNTDDATAEPEHVLSGKVFVNQMGTQVGTMADNGAASQVLDAGNVSYTIPQGYHNGKGKVTIVVEKLKTTPTKAAQEIEPNMGRVYGKVIVGAIPDEYQDVTSVTAGAEQVLVEYSIVDAEGTVVDGAMPNNGSTSATMDGLTTTSVAIPAGYTSGGTVSLTSDIEDALAAI